MKKTPTNGEAAQVSETEARAAYIALDGRRSASRVRELFGKQGRNVPSERTFEKWRSKYRWVKLAREHDEKITTKATDKIATEQITEIVTRASEFGSVTDKALKLAVNALSEIDYKTLKASDVRSLVEVAERAAKMHELLEGRATERPDDLTRAKLDEISTQMMQEVEERLAQIRQGQQPTVH